MLQAVFFDFDGVIADSEPLHLRAYQEVLRPEGIQLDRDEYYEKYLGYDDLGLFQALTKDRGLSIDVSRMDDWIDTKTQLIEEMLSSDSVLFPGAAACVRRCAEQAPLAIASGALEPEIVLVLEHSELRPFFDAIASASDGVRGKPAPDLYMLALAKLADQRKITLEPASCVAIEASHWGLKAARQAGLRCVGIAHTYPASELSEADLVVERLEEITAASLNGVIAR